MKQDNHNTERQEVAQEVKDMSRGVLNRKYISAIQNHAQSNCM